MSASTFREPLVRTRHFVDDDGAIAYVKADEDEIQITWDLTDYLASGETVSSAAYDDSGVTTSGKSVSSPNVIFTATGLGETEVTATLSTGRTVERTFRFMSPSGNRASDYKD